MKDKKQKSGAVPGEETGKVSVEEKSGRIPDGELEDISGGYGIAGKQEAIFVIKSGK